ncbi:MAG: hypothetical protein H6500_05630 [Candidatus Woesearchaeota archaeon]|nr:MAG: hypothetical protein H6500_05630 [Candidatus Woesearchaeota archaeon]
MNSTFFRVKYHNNYLYIGGAVNWLGTIFKYDVYGNQIWNKTVFLTNSSGVGGIDIDSNGDILYAGSGFGSDISFGKLRES